MLKEILVLMDEPIWPALYERLDRQIPGQDPEGREQRIEIPIHKRQTVALKWSVQNRY